VREEGQPRAVTRARDPGDEVRTFGHLGVQLAGDAVRLEVPAQVLGRAGLVPGRVDRVEADQLREERRHLVTQRDGRAHDIPQVDTRAAYFGAVEDLFSDAANERLPETAPLALRMRPQRLEDFVGQEQILGEQSALRLAIAEDRVGSSILYGPPGRAEPTRARRPAASWCGVAPKSSGPRSRTRWSS